MCALPVPRSTCHLRVSNIFRTTSVLWSLVNVSEFPTKRHSTRWKTILQIKRTWKHFSLLIPYSKVSSSNPCPVKKVTFSRDKVYLKTRTGCKTRYSTLKQRNKASVKNRSTTSTHPTSSALRGQVGHNCTVIISHLESTGYNQLMKTKQS